MKRVFFYLTSLLIAASAVWGTAKAADYLRRLNREAIIKKKYESPKASGLRDARGPAPDTADTASRYEYALPESFFIEGCPLIMQLPELARGCEVVSLAMLLRFRGVEADKLTLAERIKKDTAFYEVVEGRIHYGNPGEGFVGDMYSLNERGLGVYHGPIFELMKEYLPDESVDLTGGEFDDVLYYISRGSPVWVIVNSTYQKLGDDSFATWQTGQGEIRVTYKMHSVLITGYDEKKIYFNDPLGRNTSAERRTFIECWEQMGKQAVSCAPRAAPQAHTEQ